jgi:hypothetical protein
MLLASAAGILPEGSTKVVLVQDPSVLTINRPFSRFACNYQHYQYSYKHKVSNGTTPTLQMLRASAAAASILPERIHQSCTVQDPSG